MYTVLKSRIFFAFDTKFKSSFQFLNLFFSRSVLTLSQKESESSHKKGTCHSKSGCTGTRSCLFYMPDICMYVHKNQTFSVASASSMTGTVLMQRFRLFLGTAYPTLKYKGLI